MYLEMKYIILTIIIKKKLKIKSNFLVVGGSQGAKVFDEDIKKL